LRNPEISEYAQLQIKGKKYDCESIISDIDTEIDINTIQQNTLNTKLNVLADIIHPAHSIVSKTETYPLLSAEIEKKETDMKELKNLKRSAADISKEFNALRTDITKIQDQINSSKDSLKTQINNLAIKHTVGDDITRSTSRYDSSYNIIKKMNSILEDIKVI